MFLERVFSTFEKSSVDVAALKRLLLEFYKHILSIKVAT